VQEVAVVMANGSAPPEPARSRAVKKVGRAVTDSSLRTSVRELAFGNSAKAMVDEAMWNLAPGDREVYRAALQQGKSANEAAEAAGGQLAVIHRKIGEYTAKLEAVLSESKARIHVGEVVDKPLDQRVLEIISDGAMSDLEKDSAIQQLGALQEWAKQGLKGEITAIQANGIILAIGDRMNWGGATGVLEEFKPVYRTIFASLKTAVHAGVPDAQELHDRLTNLYAAKAELEHG
jgi:sorbitol-specific phosphotransferase system component IIA